MFPTTVVILLFIGIAPCFMQTIPVDEDLQNELRAFQESLRTMDEDMEGQDIDQKEDFETRENVADIEQQDLDESLRTINEYMEEQNVDFETRENAADIEQQDLDESLRTINEYMEEQNVDFETRENAADIEQQDLDESLRTINEYMEEQNVDFETRENTTDIAQQDLDESLRTINEYMEEQNVDFETRENAADIEQQDLDENLRTIDENMKEQDGDENVDFETRGNTEDTDIESVLEEETRTLENEEETVDENASEKEESQKRAAKIDLSKVTLNPKFKMGSVILDLKDPGLKTKVSRYLYGGSLADRVNVWKKMSTLDDMIAIANDLKIEPTKKIEDVDGLIEGDILLDKDDLDTMIADYKKDPSLLKFDSAIKVTSTTAAREFEEDTRNIESKSSAKWSLPIKYKISGPSKTKVRAAIALWEQETCIRFKERTGWIFGPNIIFKSNKPGCWSKVGKKAFSQPINLANGCQTVPIIAHEIGHSIGFWHEQSRPDRDSYVNIFSNNIKNGKAHNFVKRSWNTVKTYGIPYDYSSIMHYGIYAFTKQAGLKTITAKQPGYDRTLGQRNGLSFFDVKLANYHYCQSKCNGGLYWSKCKNGGYKNPNKCNECKCQDGWRGRYCTILARSRPSVASCGPRYRTATSSYKYLQSPGYSSALGYPTTAECSWRIRPPNGKRVRFQFTSTFRVRCNTPCKDYVEVKYKSLTRPGPRYCCSARPARIFYSYIGRDILINFRTYSGNREKGFKARYKYI